MNFYQDYYCHIKIISYLNHPHKELKNFPQNIKAYKPYSYIVSFKPSFHKVIIWQPFHANRAEHSQSGQCFMQSITCKPFMVLCKLFKGLETPFSVPFKPFNIARKL